MDSTASATVVLSVVSLLLACGSWFYTMLMRQLYKELLSQHEREIMLLSTKDEKQKGQIMRLFNLFHILNNKMK